MVLGKYSSPSCEIGASLGKLWVDLMYCFMAKADKLVGGEKKLCCLIFHAICGLPYKFLSICGLEGPCDKEAKKEICRLGR